MNRKKTLYILLSLSPTIILFVCLILFVSNINYSDVFPRPRENTHNKTFNFEKYLKKIDTNNIKATFPYRIYIDSANYDDLNCIKRDVNILNSISTKDTLSNLELFYIALSDTLKNKQSSKFNAYNPDSLYSVIQWAEKYNYYSLIDKKNEILYKAIYDYWINIISNKLEDYYKENNALKYDYKFKYLITKCAEKGYSSSIGSTNFEKILINIGENKWSYLLNRFWNGTGLFFKLPLFLFLLITLYGYYCIIRVHIKGKRE